MANSVTADVRTATTWSIVLSVLMMVTGVLAISIPMIAGMNTVNYEIGSS